VPPSQEAEKPAAAPVGPIARRPLEEIDPPQLQIVAGFCPLFAQATAAICSRVMTPTSPKTLEAGKPGCRACEGQGDDAFFAALDQRHRCPLRQLGPAAFVQLYERQWQAIASRETPIPAITCVMT